MLASFFFFFLHTNFLHLCPLSFYLFVHVCLQHFQDDIVAKGQMLTELHSSLDQHLTQDLRTMHLPVREFVTCYDMLRDKWNILKGRVEHLTEDAVEKVRTFTYTCMYCTLYMHL